MWWRVILGVLFFLLYARSPIDLIPDFFRPIGFLDDLALLAIIWWWLQKKRRETAEPSHSQEEPSSSESRSESRSHEAKPKEEKRRKSPHEVLGVPLSANEQEIEAAYKNLMKQYHPDRVHGLGEELQEVAQKKAKEINAAYEALKKE